MGIITKIGILFWNSPAKIIDLQNLSKYGFNAYEDQVVNHLVENWLLFCRNFNEWLKPCLHQFIPPFINKVVFPPVYSSFGSENYINETHREKCAFSNSVQVFIKIKVWLLLTFFLCLHTQIRWLAWLI